MFSEFYKCKTHKKLAVFFNRLQETNPRILGDLQEICAIEASLIEMHRVLTDMIEISEEYSRSEKEKMDAVQLHWNETFSCNR
jgi:hypothetical protein